MNKELILALLKVKGIGPKAVYKIIEFSNQKIESLGVLNETLSILSKSHKKFNITHDELKKNINDSLEEIENSQKLGIKTITRFSEKYPNSLKGIENPPLILNLKGNTDLINNINGLAVIGSRTPSEFGIKLAKRITSIFIDEGFDIVSGLAIGCDSIAHSVAIENRAKTIAVLANGLDSVYPKANQKLAEQILNTNGLLLSEYAVGIKPKNSYFIERDRIQSGLSKGVCVVETSVKSGTMHTVKYAENQKRVLGCIHHPEEYRNFETVKGNLELIKSKRALPLGSIEEVKKFIEHLTEINFNKSNSNNIQTNLKL